MSGTHGIAQPVRRREDVRLLTDRGRFADDVNRDGQGYASFVRSPVAHGIIRGFDADAASKAPGVIAVFVGDDLAAAGVGHIVARWPKYQSAQIQSDPPLHTPRPGLAQGKVRHVGEAVALVVAETRAQADDAAAALLYGASAAHNLPLPIDIAQAPASNSGRPSSVILFRMCTPILTSVF